MAPENLADDMSRIDPDMVVLAFGTNEGFNDSLDIDAYKAALTSIVATLKTGNPDMKIVFIGPPPGARRERQLHRRAQCLRHAVGRRLLLGPAARSSPPSATPSATWPQTVGATFWDWSSVPAAGPARSSKGIWVIRPCSRPDRVHMTGKGYRDSADAFAQVLIPTWWTRRWGLTPCCSPASSSPIFLSVVLIVCLGDWPR